MTITVYSTKHALAKRGITTHVGDICASNSTMFEYKENGCHWILVQGEWYTTHDDALRMAEYLRQNAINLLKRKLVKLENMTFFCNKSKL